MAGPQPLPLPENTITAMHSLRGGLDVSVGATAGS